MLTRIDHVMICVADLDRGIDAYTQLGFNVHPGGVHTGRGTHNAIAFFEDDYLELLSIRDKDEYLSHSAFGGLVEITDGTSGTGRTIAGSYSVDASGRATLELTSSAPTSNMIFYLISLSKLVGIDVDPNAR